MITNIIYSLQFKSKHNKRNICYYFEQHLVGFRYVSMW